MKQTLLLTSALALLTLPAAAQDLGAHVHGLAQVNVALDPSGEMVATIDTPAANITGFATREGALAALQDGAALLMFPAAAGCAFDHADIVSSHIGEDDMHDEHEGHDDHDMHDGHDMHNDHDDHNEHADHDMHDDHDDHGEHAGHINYEATYYFTCENPARVNSAELGYFEVYDGFDTINFVYIDDDTVFATELTPDNNSASW